MWLYFIGNWSKSYFHYRSQFVLFVVWNVREQYRFEAIQLIFRKFWQQIILFSRCSLLINTKAISNLYTEIHIKFFNEKISDLLHKNVVLLLVLLMMVMEAVLALLTTFPNDCFCACLLEGLQYNLIFITWKYCTIISLLSFSDCLMAAAAQSCAKSNAQKGTYEKRYNNLYLFTNSSASIKC